LNRSENLYNFRESFEEMEREREKEIIRIIKEERNNTEESNKI
jgi:hypothetical protein